MIRRPPRSTLFSLHDALPISSLTSYKDIQYGYADPYRRRRCGGWLLWWAVGPGRAQCDFSRDRKSTRLNSSHGYISYAVFCLKKKKDRNLRCRISTSSTSYTL